MIINRIKMFFILICLIVLLGGIKGNAQDIDREIVIHPNGNSWVVNDWQKNRRMITRDGIRNWSDPDDRIQTYFRVDQAGDVWLRLYLRPVVGSSKITVAMGEKQKEVKLVSRMALEIGSANFRNPFKWLYI